MDFVQSASGLKLSTPLDVGLNSGADVPHFARDRVHEYSWFSVAIAISDLDALCEVAEVSSKNNPPFSVQYSRVTAPILDDIFQWTEVANEKHFGFKIWGINSGVQFTCLDEQTVVPEWQCIRAPGKASVKLLGIICLSTSDDACGGEIEYLSNVGAVQLMFSRGVIYFFPSWTCFRFTPVEKGARLYMSFTVFGPSFQ